MFGVIVQNVLVNFVREAIGIPANAEVADEFELGSRENFPCRIIRRVQNDRLGVRAKRGRKLLFIERPIGSAQPDEPWRGTAQNCVRTVIFVKRLENHDFVARINDRHHGGHHCFGRAAANGDLALGVILDALGALKLFDDGVAQRLRAPGDGVLVDVVSDGFARRFLDFLGRRKVRKSLGQIDGAVLQSQPRHFANDGFRELLGLRRKHPP